MADAPSWSLLCPDELIPKARVESMEGKVDAKSAAGWKIWPITQGSAASRSLACQGR